MCLERRYQRGVALRVNGPSNETLTCTAYHNAEDVRLYEMVDVRHNARVNELREEHDLPSDDEKHAQGRRSTKKYGCKHEMSGLRYDTLTYVIFEIIAQYCNATARALTSFCASARSCGVIDAMSTFFITCVVCVGSSRRMHRCTWRRGLAAPQEKQTINRRRIKIQGSLSKPMAASRVAILMPFS